MNILGIDFETTSLDVETARITECAMVLWDATNHRVIRAESYLSCESELNPKSFAIPPEVQEITGLSPDFIEANQAAVYGEEQIIARILELGERADFIAAYNGASYDFPLLEARLKHWRMDGFKIKRPKEMDVMLCVPWPRFLGSPPLGVASQHHGVLNPCAHAALGDVLAMKGIMDRYDAFSIARIAESETLILIAEPSSKAEEEVVKQVRFKWDRDVENAYSMKVKAGMMEQFAAWYQERLTFPFCRSNEPRREYFMNVPFMSKDDAKERLYRWNPEAKQWRKTMSERAFLREQNESPWKVSPV